MTNKTKTFNRILEESLTIARLFYELGIERNDVIAIVSENRQEYPAIIFGAMFLNAIVAPINVTYSERKEI